MRAPSVQKREPAFERGFKTWAEASALTYRRTLGLQEVDALDPVLLAQHLKVHLWDLKGVPGIAEETVRHLATEGADEWSAVTVCLGHADVIVLNPTHSAARQTSDLMHELAHVIRKHKPAQVFSSQAAGLVVRTYDGTQEEEAEWLSGCLLLPRAALAYALSRKKSKQEMCESFGVSKPLLQYRLNVTGLNRRVTA